MAVANAAARGELFDTLPPVPPGIDDAFGHWLAGFVDGEGCFAITRKQRRGYVCYQFALKLVLRDDDAGIVHEIHERTGLGSVFVPKRRMAVDAGRPQLGWLVSSRLDCRTVVAIFDRYPLRAKKARDFAIWRDAVLEWTARPLYVGGNRGPQDWSRIGDYSRRLREVRAYGEA